MRKLLIFLFLAVLVLTVYLTLSNNEKFMPCFPDTYRGTPLQSYDNPFKGNCFTEEDDNYKETPVPNIEQIGNLSNDSKYCFNSIRVPALLSHKNDTKPWCYLPQFN